MTRAVRGIAFAAGWLSLAAGAADPIAERIVTQGTPAGAPACVACHGPDGAGNAAANFPRLAGLDAAYQEKQLADIRAGTRQSPVMVPIAKGLTEAESKAVARHYARLKAPPAPPPAVDPQQLALGERVATRGVWARDVPPCFTCHGAGGQGVGLFPALAGQHATYTAAQLHEWRNGNRRNDQLGLMKVIADRMTPAEIQAVAAYLATLKPSGGTR